MISKHLLTANLPKTLTFTANLTETTQPHCNNLLLRLNIQLTVSEWTTLSIIIPLLIRYPSSGYGKTHLSCNVMSSIWELNVCSVSSWCMVLKTESTLTRVKAALVGSIFRLLTALTVARAMEADMLKLLKHFVFGCKHQRQCKERPPHRTHRIGWLFDWQLIQPMSNRYSRL